MNAIAWLLTYLLPIALVAFGTVTQGDDDPWRLSFFIFAPVVASRDCNLDCPMERTQGIAMDEYSPSRDDLFSSPNLAQLLASSNHPSGSYRSRF